MLAVDTRGHFAEVAVQPSAGASAATVPEPLLLRAEAIPIDSPLREAIETFRRHPDARFLAVVDERSRPLGAVNERVVRDLLFSPFGHALVANPGCEWTLRSLIGTCASVEQDVPIAEMIAAYGDAPDPEGVILTVGGRYAALLPGQALLQLAAARQRGEAEAARRRSGQLEHAFAHFRSDAVEFSQSLATAASEIHASARGVAERASRNGEQAIGVAAASTQSSDGIAEIASSSAELVAQVGRIEARVAEALAAFEQASSHVRHASDKARGLTTAADEIGAVTGLIASIAATVNMLAINATIEAARAGPAGRGFAVVAGEVKSLAGQTAAAAAQIEDRIKTVRAAVAENRESNQAIESIVGCLGGICADISSSVREQAFATALIATNVEQAALGSAKVSGLIGEIGERASTAGGMAARLGEVAEELGSRADGLRDRVETFLREVRAA